MPLPERPQSRRAGGADVCTRLNDADDFFRDRSVIPKSESFPGEPIRPGRERPVAIDEGIVEIEEHGVDRLQRRPVLGSPDTCILDEPAISCVSETAEPVEKVASVCFGRREATQTRRF
jgi:hypothetical protein